MLPSLSRLVLDEDANTHDMYEASMICPHPAGAGDIRRGVELTPGSSGAFLSADSTNYKSGRLSTEDVEQDWLKGTVALDEFSTFIHVASAGLPENLVEGSKLRTLKRTYSHTDTANWTWRGGDRVEINWPPNMPFQIMAGLRGAAPYQRPCRFLKGEEAKDITLKPNSNGVIDWPFANVAVVLPPAFYSVDDTPTHVLSPKVAAQTFEVVSSEIIQTAVEMPHNGLIDPFNRNHTIFRSDDKDGIEKLKSFFDKNGGKYRRYDTTLTTKIEDYNKKRKAFMVAVNISDSNLIYELYVKRTCMYEFLSLTAHYIDFSGFVASGLWFPEDYEFQKPFANYLTTTTPPPPVLIDSSLKDLVILHSLFDSHEEKPVELMYAFDASIKQTDANPEKRLQTFSQQDLSRSITDFLKPETINNPLSGTSITIFDYILNIIQKYLKEYDEDTLYDDRIGDFAMVLIESLKVDGIKIKYILKADKVAFEVIEAGEDVEVGQKLVKALWKVQQPSIMQQRNLLEKIDGNGDYEGLAFLIDNVGFIHDGTLSNYPAQNL